jgi:nucleoside-diphosphate-sugar epimerase
VKALVTGATGFIGGRLAEVLVDRGVDVVGLVRRWGGASRLARLPVQMVGGDVLDFASVRRAMQGADTVFHCAMDFRVEGKAHRRSAVAGTENVLKAALEAGVSRVVHLSSAAVHGLGPRAGTDVSEDGLLRKTGHAYCDGKIDAEAVALDLCRRRGLPVAVLRPTLVYGPFGFFSALPARLARQGRLLLVNGALGTCNALYVDNLIQAMLLAATREEAVGEVFNVSDSRTVQWSEFLEAHAAAVSPEMVPLPVVKSAELEATRRRLRRHAVRVLMAGGPRKAVRSLKDPAVRQGFFLIPGAAAGSRLAKGMLKKTPAGFRGALKNALGGRGVPPRADTNSGTPRSSVSPTLSPSEEESMSVFSEVTFDISKARRVLGYEPSVDFAEGMARTAQWIRWAGI